VKDRWGLPVEHFGGQNTTSETDDDVGAGDATLLGSKALAKGALHLPGAIRCVLMLDARTSLAGRVARTILDPNRDLVTRPQIANMHPIHMFLLRLARFQAG
jgi:hypothetical protein